MKNRPSSIILCGLCVLCGYMVWKTALAMRAFQSVEKPPEEIGAGVRAGGGFGVVLHAEGGHFEMVEAFDRVVVEAAVSDLQAAGQRIFLDREAVVLRRDLDRLGVKVLHGVIGAAVAELEFERLCPAGQPEQLVAEADAKDRLLAQERANRADRIVERLRGSRAAP